MTPDEETLARLDRELARMDRQLRVAFWFASLIGTLGLGLCVVNVYLFIGQGRIFWAIVFAILGAVNVNTLIVSTTRERAWRRRWPRPPSWRSRR